MLFRRPRASVRRDSAAGLLVLAVLYLVAAVLNVLLMISMAAVWPLVLAALFAIVAGMCLVFAVLERRQNP